MFYLLGHQSHCHIEDGDDGLPTTQSSLVNMLVCSEHPASLPPSPPNKPCSSSNTVDSSGLTAIKSTEQTSQLSPAVEKDMGKFLLDHILLATLLFLNYILICVFDLMLNKLV